MLADNARWDGFQFRADDIVISTPGKCGTTWVQMICALLVFGDPKLPRRLSELSPWVDMQTDSVDNVFASLADQEHRRFIKSHRPLDGLPYDKRVTYITVGRDCRDVAISWENHGANSNFDAFFWARDAAVGLEDAAERMPDDPPVRIEDPSSSSGTGSSTTPRRGRTSPDWPSCSTTCAHSRTGGMRATSSCSTTRTSRTI